jgi:exopolysaccharide production protein ExoZ
MTMGDTTSLNTAGNRTTKLESIQAMRGIAALLVVVAHSISLATSGRATEGWALVGHIGYFPFFGAIGVDLFFVISGFVMAFSVAKTKGGPRSASVFLAKRWTRIAPPYWIASIVMVALSVLGLSNAVRMDAISTFNLIMFVPWADNSAYTLPPLYVGWTLSFEFSFYLLVAVMVAFGLAQRMKVLALALVVMVTLGLVFPTEVFILGWFSNPILLEFAFGIGAYLMWSSGWMDRRRSLCIAAGLVGCGALILQLVIGYGRIWDMGAVLDGRLSLARVIIWGIPAFLIFVAVLPLRPGINFASTGLMRLGDASFSVYLVHIPVLYVLDRMLETSPVKLPADIIMILGTIVAVSAGFVYFRRVEKPMTALASNKVTAILATRATAVP